MYNNYKNKLTRHTEHATEIHFLLVSYCTDNDEVCICTTQNNKRRHDTVVIIGPHRLHAVDASFCYERRT